MKRVSRKKIILLSFVFGLTVPLMFVAFHGIIRPKDTIMKVPAVPDKNEIIKENISMMTESLKNYNFKYNDYNIGIKTENVINSDSITIKERLVSYNRILLFDTHTEKFKISFYVKNLNFIKNNKSVLLLDAASVSKIENQLVYYLYLDIASKSLNKTISEVNDGVKIVSDGELNNRNIKITSKFYKDISFIIVKSSDYNYVITIENK